MSTVGPVEVAGADLDPGRVRALYDSVGWGSCTDDLPALLRGLAGSHLSTDAAGTPEATASHPFYRDLGLVPHEEIGLAAFVRPTLPAPSP